MKTLAIFCLFLLFSCQTQTEKSDSQNQKIEELFQHVDHHTPGYSVAIIKDSEYLFQKEIGLANLEYQIPITSKTVFNVASLSKQFTAACIALLILENKISLEDNINQYLPDFPNYGYDIQIKHLIYMTSGINDYYYNPRKNGSDWSSLHFFNIDTAIMASLGNDALMYSPGSQWSYSNINYMLLTKVVEKVSGKRFSEFAKEKIFEPLEMNNTVVNDDIFQIISNRAEGYNFRDEENTKWLKESGYLNSDQKGFLQISRNSPHYGGSGVFTSMDDFKKWIDNFQSKKFGGQAFYELMHQTMKFDHDKSNDAFGLVHGQLYDQDVIWYEGGDWGFSSYMVRFPDHNLTAVCFSNLGTGNARKHAKGVLEILIEEGKIKL